MSISLFFGLPGCGKTTILTSIAYTAIKKKQYDFVYSNVKLSIPGVTYITNDCIGKYALRDCLILIDEATLYADSRDYANFSKGQVTFFLEHRHFNSDIYLFTQQWDGCDRRIRVITDRVYYVYKGLFLGKWFSRYYRIPYGIIIPDPKRGADQKLGEIIQGYCQPNFLIRLFSPWVYRPKYYKYFDSWEIPPGFPPLPTRFSPFYESPEDACLREEERKHRQSFKRNIAVILLRSVTHRAAATVRRISAAVSRFFDKHFKPSSK